MLQRDYISRLIRKFMAALQRYLEKDEISERREAVADLYRQYLGGYTFYHAATLDEIMRSFEEYPPEERAGRMEMLAELYYAEADLVVGPTRTMLLDKALALFHFITRHDRTYDMMRLRKMADIEKRLDVAPQG